MSLLKTTGSTAINRLWGARMAQQRCSSLCQRSKRCITQLSKRSAATKETSATQRSNCSVGEYPVTYTQSHVSQVERLEAQRRQLGPVKEFSDTTQYTESPFYWPFGSSKRTDAPSMLLYGAMGGVDRIPLVPLVYQWHKGVVPSRFRGGKYELTFNSEKDLAIAKGLRTPGVSTVYYLGSGLGLGSARGEVHPGILTSLMDDGLARASIATSAAPGMILFTANFQVEYLERLPVDRFIVVDTWITSVDGRKNFLVSNITDAESGQRISRAKSLFVSTSRK